MEQIEEKLNELFVKRAPFQLPEGLGRYLVKMLPSLAIVIGCGLLWLLSEVYRAARALDASPALWVIAGLLAIQAMLLVIAAPKLRARKKSGWNILLWLAALNVIYNALSYTYYHVQFGSLVSSVLGTLAGLYLLFQVRRYYIEATLTPGATSSAAKQPDGR